MKKWVFEKILTGEGWKSNYHVVTDSGGRIISPSNEPEETETIRGISIPPFYNAHSHAFQYAMIGLAEKTDRGSNDSFWTWRDTMYKIANKVSPNDIEAIATMLYHDLLVNGYTHVAEFHYLHNNFDGTPYADPAEISKRIISAARTVGIKLTLIPILYQNGGFGKPATSEQRRFILDVDHYLDILNSVPTDPSINSGLGFHSLRAVDGETISQLSENYKGNAIHIHISEQLKEVADCLSFTGNRPVMHLSELVDLDQRWNLVHATHSSSEELNLIASKGSRVVICPSTEGNLGDGIFPIEEYGRVQGKWCFGTDSHIGLCPFEELRLLDYSNRMTTHKRLPFQDDSMDSLILNVHASGAQAAGLPAHKFLQEGSFLDLLVLDDSHPLLALHDENILDTLIYHFNRQSVKGVIVNGQWVITEGIHPYAEMFRERFLSSMKKLELR